MGLPDDSENLKEKIEQLEDENSQLRAQLSRSHKKEPQVLYHYCSAEAFTSIVQSGEHGTIRASAMNLSNDSMEGRLAIQELMRRWKTEGVSNAELLELQKHWDGFIDNAVALAFCLSAEGDLLSQWRAYADDGRGVSIGFARSYFQSEFNDDGKPRLHQVSYLDRKSPQPMLDRLHSLIKEKVVRTPEFADFPGLPHLIYRYCNGDLFALKGEAFREEQEWRLLLVHPVHMVREYRHAKDRIIPFRSYPLAHSASRPPIVEVVLGPKHTTPIPFVRAMLNKRFGDVQVVRSKATYQ